MKYEKGSFIVVPNIPSVMGIGGMEQALYIWLCYHANQYGDCFPSRTTLAGYLKCDVRSVDKYLKSLEDAGLVKKEHRFTNNEQTSNNYHLPLYQGGVNISRGSVISSPPPAKILRTELNPVLTQSINSSEAPLRIESETPKKDKTYSEVFELFSARKQPWMTYKAQIEAAKRLKAQRGVKQVKAALSFYREHKGEKYLPHIDTPFDLESKWTKLFHFKENL